MEFVVRKDILSIIRQAIRILRRKDIPALDELSNHTIHNASVFQDSDSISIAVVVYALSKIIHRSEGKPIEKWEQIYDSIMDSLQNARAYLEQNKDDKFRWVVKSVLSHIGRVDEKLKLYIDDVLSKARVVKGTKLYEHGISIERAAALLGVSQWEMMSYVGKTQIIDAYEEEVIPISERLSYAKKLFRV